ncbi:TonB-dependent siderophore receptor [Paracoccus laeviglucosivorans]|uniref:TonB-dependent Receptor Plug Domain n=1 Tax=Paracoccus laeviglucosivorans TaxID=1197861 RepID=A0A521FTK2_9RHOB|nr:TonB-dependent receptor [Paracoccus laeviglucosivorans]SMO98831.1 TonB-dependent Receptor Plug Domain [Paracoccus laeviglucosivorans]
MRKSIATTAVLGMSLGVVAIANAQDTTNGSDPYVLDTVVLKASEQSTAEQDYVAPTSVNRVQAEPLDTPQTITAFTAARITDQDIRSDLDLLQMTPGVDVTSKEGFSRIRGFSAQTAIEGIPVGTFIGRQAADLSAFEQVEILKGPAAIFQGEGAAGGMINYSFKRPTGTETLQVKAGFGDPTSRQLQVDYNIAPLLDGRLRARFVGAYEDRDQFDPEKYERASLYAVTEYDLTDSTVLRFSAWRQSNDVVQGFRAGLPTYSDGTLIDFPQGTTATQDWSLYKFRSLWLNAEVEHEFNDRWKLRLAYRNGDSHHSSTRSVAGLCENPSVPGYEAGGIDRDDPDGRQCYALSYWNDWNQYEIYDANLNGAFDAFGHTHDVLLGFTLKREWFRRAFGRGIGANSEFIVDIFDPNPHVVDRPDYIIDEPWGAKGDPNNQYTLFGQVNFQATDRLSIPIGGRFTWLKTADGDWTAKGEFTPSISAVYKISDNTMVYAQYAQMFTANRGGPGIWTGLPLS